VLMPGGVVLAPEAFSVDATKVHIAYVIHCTLRIYPRPYIAGVMLVIGGI